MTLIDVSRARDDEEASSQVWAENVSAVTRSGHLLMV